ncbi:ABC transporter substrate-binding protein [Prauserella marina]|uniref:Phospholipid/cholesterol/gamma-HCH transport system substrate-binding protein n=1 Tax=Prauserella marina TaxID=530584 RepID=A0A222VJH0_9PSEU|nr:MCE family protein [Prauserella marina]ASR34070.1 ABC transporter substrate-binding protein [Prauserella marina]PWV82706.1 phospholipid/cholesterol/gamma-HCH transport system substrate-binding protein [Prauserella marina]SDC75248.1 phospholipid/cholesterol/gamma-HCH transport system substrate-binding protein [Prauserella marina]
MKSFRKRNPIPIALVGIVLMVLGTVAALNSDDLPIIGGGTTYTADFSESAGLQTDDEVRVAGIKVGKVTDIELDGDRVRVSFKVKDAWLGDRTTAAIKIKTLLGQKYVALDPLGDTALDPSDTIPRERTAAPYDVLEAFRGLSQTVEEIDTKQLAQSFDVLSETFANTPEDVRGALDGLSELSTTIASRDKQLSSLLSNTRQVTQTLADRDAEFTKLLEDGNKLLDELSRREQAISTLLEGSRSLATQLQGLVDDNSGQLDPVLTQLDRLTSMLQRNQEALANGIKEFAPFIRVFNNTIGSGRWFDNYICGLLLPSVGPLNEEGCNAR